MDDIGNVVYVLAVIGYMVYRAFAGKKPKTQPQRESEESKGVTIEDILKQLTNKEEESESWSPEPVPVVDEHKGHVHDAKPFLTVDAPSKPKREYKMSQDEISRHKRVSERLNESKSNEELYVDRVVEELSEGVDLRRAIIYQTILETPYLRQV